MIINVSLKKLYEENHMMYEGQERDILHVVTAMHVNIQSVAEEQFELDSSMNGYGGIIQAINGYGR